MAVDGRPITSVKFDRAIVLQAVDFAQRVLAFTDPKVQSEHEQGLEEIRAGKSLTIDQLREHLDLR